RDQLFGTDKKILPSGEPDSVAPWESIDDRNLLIEESAPDVIDEIEHSMEESQSLSDLEGGVDATEPFPAIPPKDTTHLDSWSLERLDAYADALGIPGRDNLSREELIQAIRNTRQVS